ncbi:MAG: GNAT family N-acetyltransferase [Micromonosporaceae bacterium]|nr:GNAT family N-acetyltransferase [Micromonosporaceae bacterium]
MNACHHPAHGIRPAVPGEAAAVAETIACAFEPLDMTGWLVPDRGDRVRIMTGFLQLTVEHALVHGTVDIIGDLFGVAVWLPSHAPDIDGYDRRLEEACGVYADRFRALDTAMHTAHPTGRPHEYLPFIAVRRQVQTRGLGNALLDHHHTLLDLRGVPSYLEAASPDSARLYRRHGYESINNVFGPAGSDARLRPMWREPRREPSPDDPARTAVALASPVSTPPTSLDLGVVDAVSGSRDPFRGNSAPLSGRPSQPSRAVAGSGRGAEPGGDDPGSGLWSGVGRPGPGRAWS